MNILLSDEHLKILATLYWHGQQKSRKDLDIRPSIDELIDAGYIKEYKQDWVFFGMVWLVNITDSGKEAFLRADPLRVVDIFIQLDTSDGAYHWIEQLAVECLPKLLSHRDQRIREAALKRLYVESDN